MEFLVNLKNDRFNLLTVSRRQLIKGMINYIFMINSINMIIMSFCNFFLDHEKLPVIKKKN